ncbi:MAG: methyl-accepting chemotaxis protein [Pseudomonadota bacterium]
MTEHSHLTDLSRLNKLSSRASEIGYEIVDLAGFLDMVEAQGRAQSDALGALEQAATRLGAANSDTAHAAQALQNDFARMRDDVDASAGQVQALGGNTTDVAQWVKELSAQTDEIGATLGAVKKNNGQIAAIAMQVNTLAINAKIEAARAGEAGRGFAVVAEAINELSQKTRDAAERITGNIEGLTGFISTLGSEAQNVAATASEVIDQANDTNAAMGRIVAVTAGAADRADQIARLTAHAGQAVEQVSPRLAAIADTVTATTTGISEAHDRINRLVDTSEDIVQASAALGGTTQDAPFIAYVTKAAKQASAAFEAQIDSRRISLEAMFDTRYAPVVGSDPAQVTTAFTAITDAVMPAIQEPALAFDDKVVFCAAVDRNGYLPTHNTKFSKPQGNDPVWNTANSRNRRIFDDRVGLKAGRSTDPFLLQVYRRDMGGGAFVMMKDVSAPIRIKGRHWGGLRLAYTF